MANPLVKPAATPLGAHADTADMTPLVAATATGIAACNRIILDRMQSDIPLIPQLAGHLIAAGGKRMRPMLVLAGQAAAQDTASKQADQHAAKLAAAIEFIHTATLLHDDVIDESDMRRNHKTASAIWGNAASVLVGDFLFARAFALLVEVGNSGVLQLVAAAAARITEGEIAQMLMVGKPEASMEAYLRVIQSKTAELFAAAAESGALVGGADKDLATALRDYGMALGMAFQIADDALDYVSDSGVMGKTAGDDFREGKITMPVLLAYQRGDGKQRQFWRQWLGEKAGKAKGETEDARTAFAEAQGLLTQHGIIDACLAEAEKYASGAIACLDGVPDSPIRTALTAAARFVAGRDR